MKLFKFNLYIVRVNKKRPPYLFEKLYSIHKKSVIYNLNLQIFKIFFTYIMRKLMGNNAKAKCLIHNAKGKSQR